MFIIRETFRYLRRAWAAWLLESLTLGVALAVSGLFALMAWNAHTAMRAARANLAIEAFFDPALSSEDAQVIVHSDLGIIPGVARMVFISKEQALNDYTAASGEDIEQVLGMNPLPASLKMYLRNPTASNVRLAAEQLKTIPNVEDVKTDLPLLTTLESRSDALDRTALVLGSLLILAAFFQSLAAASHGKQRRRETNRALTRMGATRAMISIPVILYALLAGLAGGVLGAVLILFARAQFFSAMSGMFTVETIPSMNRLVLGVIIGAGIIISGIASAVNYWRNAD